MQKVSKKENTTKIFLKLSFFGNISVCVVAVKAVYWGTGPVSGVSCCCDSLGSTSSRRARAAAASRSAAATHSELRTAFEHLQQAAQISRQTGEGKNYQFLTKISAGMFPRLQTHLAFLKPTYCILCCEIFPSWSLFLVSNHEHLSANSLITQQQFKLKCPFNKEYWNQRHSQNETGNLMLVYF